MKVRELKEITQAHIHARFDYDKSTGFLNWKIQPAPKRNIGDRAGSIEPNGYRRVTVTINSKQYALLEHRLVWMFVHGVWPANYLDHINGNKADNRIVNLREATNSQNMRNQPAQKHSVLKIKGVYPAGNKFRARFYLNGKHLHLGTFTTTAAAEIAYQAEAIKHAGQFCNFSKPMVVGV